MNRILRWLFHLASAVSVVVFAGLCLAWAQSDRVIHVVRIRGNRYLYTATASGGMAADGKGAATRILTQPDDGASGVARREPAR